MDEINERISEPVLVSQLKSIVKEIPTESLMTVGGGALAGTIFAAAAFQKSRKLDKFEIIKNAHDVWEAEGALSGYQKITASEGWKILAEKEQELGRLKSNLSKIHEIGSREVEFFKRKLNFIDLVNIDTILKSKFDGEIRSAQDVLSKDLREATKNLIRRDDLSVLQKQDEFRKILGVSTEWDFPHDMSKQITEFRADRLDRVQKFGVVDNQVKSLNNYMIGFDDYLRTTTDYKMKEMYTKTAASVVGLSILGSAAYSAYRKYNRSDSHVENELLLTEEENPVVIFYQRLGQAMDKIFTK